LRVLHVLANPNSQSGRGGRILPELEASLRRAGHDVRLHRTTHPGHARSLAAGIAASAEAAPILVVGGDGTLHEVANGLRDAGFPDGFPLALLPMGTGNDFHRILRAGSGVAEVVELLDSGVPRRLDLGEVRWDGGDAAFVNLLGVGIDVEVLRRRGAFARFPGLVQYGAALLSALRRFRPVPLRVTRPGVPGEASLEAEALLAVATVGPSIGGGFMLSPDARAEDGLLDLFFVEPLSLVQLLRYLPRVVRGTLGTPDRIHRATFGCARFVSTDGRSFPFELDGELMPDATPWLEIDILPGALTVLDRP
jgi:diacylglycerol kinase (ATP)